MSSWGLKVLALANVAYDILTNVTIATESIFILGPTGRYVR